MKFLRTKVLQVILFSLTLVGVGVSTWFIASNFLSTKNSLDFNPGNEKKIELKKSKDVPVTLIEHETNGYFFFGIDGLALINERIKTDLQFGPEIEALKTIRFNNLNVLSKNVNGQYSPSTLEVDISIDHLLPEFKNIPISEKIELVFPTIFHEYGHHFANTFITSITKNDSRNSRKLYTKYFNNTDKSIHKNVPRAFLNKFEEALHYDDSEVSNLLNIDNNDVSSIKSAKEFYNLSNNISIKYNIEGNDYLGIDEFEFQNKIPFRRVTASFPVNSNRYTYLFSIDELLTRKLQQITYIDNRNENSIANKTTTFTGTEYNDGYSPSTMATDISRNKSIKYSGNNNYELSEKLLLMDYPYGGHFHKKDGSIININPTVETLWNAYYDIAGYDYGISQIYMHNSSTLASNSSRTPMSKRDFELIRFTGFLSNSSSKNYKGLLLSTEGSYEEYKFLENNYKYSLMGAKSGILNRTRDLNKKRNKFGYSTNYIDITKVDFNQPIKVWNDKNNNNKYDVYEDEPLTVSPKRPTSTFRESFITWFDNGDSEKTIDTHVEKIFEVINNSGEALIQHYSVGVTLINPLLSSQIIDSSNTSGIQVIDNVIVFNNRNDRKKR
ncbi:MAG: MYPU_1760 family metalloprotease [Metamycoplasmataceae bacterium]